jgi:hypothetical protein
LEVPSPLEFVVYKINRGTYDFRSLYERESAGFIRWSGWKDKVDLSIFERTGKLPVESDDLVKMAFSIKPGVRDLWMQYKEALGIYITSSYNLLTAIVKDGKPMISKAVGNRVPEGEHMRFENMPVEPGYDFFVFGFQDTGPLRLNSDFFTAVYKRIVEIEGLKSRGLSTRTITHKSDYSILPVDSEEASLYSQGCELAQGITSDLENIRNVHIVLTVKCTNTKSDLTKQVWQTALAADQAKQQLLIEL